MQTVMYIELKISSDQKPFIFSVVEMHQIQQHQQQYLTLFTISYS